MARPLRLDYPGAVWHITSRGNERKNIFRSDADRRLFLEFLADAVRRYGWLVYSYVLMSNHYHFVVETPVPNLSRGMQWLNGKYAQRFNKRHKRVGHLFQGRFKGFLVEKDLYLNEVLRYVVLNPVRAGMVSRPEEYRWSSYRATAGYCASPGWLATDRVLDRIHPDHEQARQSYREYVDERLTDPRSPWENLVAQLYLGSEAWIEKMREVIEAKPRSDEHPQAQRTPLQPPMATIIEAVAETFHVDSDLIRHGHGGVERMVTAWLGCYEGMHWLRSIAASLRLRSTGRASDLIRICDAELDRDPLLRIAVDRCCDRLRGSPPSTSHPIGPTALDSLPASAIK
ncbi:MAG TPA: transposase [Thermoanaerobaculia bacterium]|nr:transposase [Thermoanaerobaculia bacterium]